ncbi:hypothetical protein [Neoroseomonas soli]|uniref:Uncharacterized protein n=1 Tax=Neoroseomonas soli TaxID=1081025 RepID=A0A9X9WX71_9PROT|nr:hypothetical protein [Neoroseomonas soli]MBR0671750.1 hypothetical protein [Neoroseomonas soli]
MTRLGRIARSAGLVLGTGYVLCFFSEAMFWSFWRPDEEPFGRVAQWLLYSLFGYLTLVVVALFRLRGGWALLMAGAFYGWLGEGLVAMTVYGDPSMPFPVTIAWTALAWHAPLSVVVGWYWLGMALRAPRIWPTARLSLVLGLFWGVWGFGWMAETPPLAAEPFEFLANALGTTLCLGLAHRAIAAGARADYRPWWPGVAVVSSAALAFFALVTVPAIPFAPIVLLPLLALLGLAMRRRSAAAPDESLLVDLAAPIRGRNFLALALMPVCASVVYAAATTALPPLDAIHLGFAVIAIPVGTALFGIALARALRRRI